jgi:hypothetical protein
MFLLASWNEKTNISIELILPIDSFVPFTIKFISTFYVKEHEVLANFATMPNTKIAPNLPKA